MTAVRYTVGALGVGLAAYGTWLLLDRGHDLADVVAWLLAGVVLHDVVVAGATILLGAFAVRIVPVPVRGPLVVGFVVAGSVTLLGVPVLGRFGARPDNPTLLDRDYTAGWLVLVGMIAVAVGVAALLRSRRARRRR